jgi:acyl carrier protein
MVPALFEVLPALPLTPSGKIDRARLPEPASGGASSADYLAPRNAVERKMAEIWAETLGVDRIGIADNFFHSGGHSLLAAQVMSRVRREWEIELPMRALFECPTVAGLADRLQTMLWVSGSQRPRSAGGRDREHGQL